MLLMTSDRKRQSSNPEDRARELAARKRVAALVSGGLHVKMKREGNQVQGTRGSSPAKLIARLTAKNFFPEVTLDVRGQAAAEIRERIAAFITSHHRRGVQQMLIVFDPSTGAEDAENPLEIVLSAVTVGAAAALVRAFSTPRDGSRFEASLALLLI